MNSTRLVRFVCRVSAGIALASTMSVAAMASQSTYFVPEGESRVYRLARPVTRVAVGNSDIADFIVLNSTELYLLGKKAGATNLVLWDKQGNITSASLQVNRNVTTIKELLRAVLPNETDIRVFAQGGALVLTGSVSDSVAAETVNRLVKAYLGGTVSVLSPETTLTSGAAASGSSAPAGMTGSALSSPTGSGSSASAGGGMPGSALSSLSGSGTATSAGLPGVVNLLKVRAPQQVRLEVHIAEVSRSFIESLGLGWTKDVGNTQGGLMSGFVSNATLDLIMESSIDPVTRKVYGKKLQVDAERKEGLIKILAEPTIVAMSGQEGYFLVGGKIYTPTVGANGSVDYVERTYGVGLRFTPTVLDAGRISLKVAPEVSEPLTEPVTAGTQSQLPAFKISAASTTVQMKEGENLVIGGLLRDNLSEIIRAVPLLGDIPVFGTLFRHTQKSTETTELMVIIRPTLVKASTTVPELPTDKLVPPTQKELFIDGRLQGSHDK